MFNEKEMELVKGSWLCRLATADKNCQPHATPIAYVYDGRYFLMNTDKGNKKHRNLRTNPKVAIVIDELKPKRGIVIYGSAELIEGKNCLPFAKTLKLDIEDTKVMFHGIEQVVIRVIPKSKATWGFT